MPIQVNPISLLISREIALRQNVEKSRAVPLALIGSMLGGATKTPLAGPLLTRHLAQREAIPVPPRAPSKDDAATDGGTTEQSSVENILRLAAVLRRERDLARARAEKARTLLAAAEKGFQDATREYSRVAEAVHQRLTQLDQEWQASRQYDNDTYEKAVANANELAKTLGVDASASKPAGTEQVPPGSAAVATPKHAKGSKVNNLIPAK